MELIPHPNFPCDAVSAIEVEAERRPHSQVLRVRYRVIGDISALVWPQTKPGGGERSDGLWMSTCLEAFIRPEGSEGYFEANVSPSSDWAAYAFAGYRDGMREEHEVTPGGIMVGQGRDAGLVESWIGLSGFSESFIRVSITAVIEEKGGRKSYWALAHPPGRPDFHHADGFTLELAPV